MTSPLADQVLALLDRRPAAFVTEVAAALRTTAAAGTELEAALRELSQQRRILVQDHAAPDVHLATLDLRVITPLDDDEAVAIGAAESYWNTWLRAFFSTHRCQ